MPKILYEPKFTAVYADGEFNHCTLKGVDDEMDMHWRLQCPFCQEPTAKKEIEKWSINFTRLNGCVLPELSSKHKTL